MISHEYKCINVHIPRTGGSSIEMMLAGKIMENADHKTIHHYRKEDKNVFNDYFKFSFVRNPWSKMVSHFIRHCINRPPKRTFEGPYQSEFKDWIKHIPKQGAPKFNKTSNQLDWLCDKRWKNQISPIDFKIDVDFVGRFGNYEEDWNFISQKINLKSELPHSRPGILNDENLYPRDYREYYDDESIEIVRKRYEDDVNFFDYKFGEI